MSQKITPPDLASEDNQSTPPTITTLLSVRQAAIICQNYIDEINRERDYNEDFPAAREALSETVQQLVRQNRQIGNADTFHNFVVELAANGFSDLACDVLDCALEIFPANVDLLADYLLYGIQCQRLDQCETHFTTLRLIEQSEWTWRCFEFSIAYVNHLKDNIAATSKEKLSYKKQVSELARAYKKHLPYEEGGYCETAKLLVKKPDAMLKELNDALSNKMIGACPACAIEKANLLFKQKNYEEALTAIDRSLEDSVTQTQGGIKESYILFLRGLCKFALLLPNIQNHDNVNSEAVLEIYADFNRALYRLDEGYAVRLKDRTQSLIDSTSVQVPDEMERLLNLLDQN